MSNRTNNEEINLSTQSDQNPEQSRTNCQNAEKGVSNDGIDKSTRFSIRVLEAMRSLQRRNNDLVTLTSKDIAEYIKANYNFDGDLEAQVRTVLPRIWRQGFTIKIGKEKYFLIGPFAAYMNKIDHYLTMKSLRKRKRKSTSRSKDSSDKRSKKKKESKKQNECENSDRNVNENNEVPNSQEVSAENRKKSKTQKKTLKSKSRPSAKKRVMCRPKKRSKAVNKKAKSPKKRVLLTEEPDCECACFDDDQPESSKNSYVTCCDYLNSEKSIPEKKMLKSDLNHHQDFPNSSQEIKDSYLSKSDDESSVDSIYQKLKLQNSKTQIKDSKDLKKWIKNCKQKIARH